MKVYSFSLIFIENAIELAKHYNFTYTETIDFDDNETYIIFGTHEQDYAYKLLLYKYKNKKDYIVINSEQPTSVLFNNKYYQQLLRVSRVVDYNSLSVDVINKTVNSGAKCCYFFDFPINTPNKSKEYDIVFIGSHSNTRENVYNCLRRKYPDKNILFDFGYNYKKIDKLTNLLVNTKIVLNIPYYSDGILEIHRINKALSCGCTVVSTRGKDEYVNKLYEDYIHFTNDLLNFEYDNLEGKYEYCKLRQLLYKTYKFLDMVAQHNEPIVNSNIGIIVARYNEDVTWTNEFPNVIIYNKGDKLDIDCINVENVGREPHTYYKYIVDNYENLKYGHYIFLQGYPFDHSPNVIKTLRDYINSKNLTIDFSNISERVITFDFKNGCKHHQGLPLVENYIKIFNKYPDQKIYSFGAGAQFIVSRERILKNPKVFYENILNLLSKEKRPIEAYVLERLHGIIFS